MGIWTVFNAVFGLILLGQGVFKRRRIAIRNGQSVPAIGLHAVFLLPVAIWLAWKGARDLKMPA